MKQVEQLQDRLNDEMQPTQNKKLWRAPELEVLGGRKTYGGEDDSMTEEFWAGVGVGS